VTPPACLMLALVPMPGSRGGEGDELLLPSDAIPSLGRCPWPCGKLRRKAGGFAGAREEGKGSSTSGVRGSFLNDISSTRATAAPSASLGNAGLLPLEVFRGS